MFGADLLDRAGGERVADECGEKDVDGGVRPGAVPSSHVQQPADLGFPSTLEFPHLLNGSM